MKCKILAFSIGLELLFLLVGGMAQAVAGNISGFSRVEGSGISTVTTLPQSSPTFYLGRASILTTHPGIVLFSIIDPMGADDLDLLTLNVENETGLTVSTIDIQLGQIGTNGDFETLPSGGPTIIAPPRVGGRVLGASRMVMENLEWEPGDSALAINPFLFITSASNFINGELAVQIEAIAVPEPTASALLVCGALALLSRSRRVQ